MSIPPQPPSDPEHPHGSGPPDDTPTAYSQTPYGHPGYAQDAATRKIPQQQPYPQDQGYQAYPQDPGYQDRGYGYGYDYAAPPPPPKKRWPWAVGGVAVLVVAGLAAVLVIALTGDAADDAAAVTQTAPVPASEAASATGAAPMRTADAGVLPTSGTFKVGTDIQPGEYAVSPAGGATGYWERLSCTTGEFECIIANDNVSGPGYLTIPPGDVAVRVERLRLVPTGAAPVTAPPATTPPAAPPPARDADLATDGQGFVGRPGAHCNSDDPAMAVARTDSSLVVVCETGAGRFYYKGLRLRDGATIEIDDPVPAGSGFKATNDGVRYWLTSTALIITDGSQRLADEPVLQYWTR